MTWHYFFLSLSGVLSSSGFHSHLVFRSCGHGHVELQAWTVAWLCRFSLWMHRRGAGLLLCIREGERVARDRGGGQRT